jgi:hypothetical protein
MPLIQHLILVVPACESFEILIPKKLPLHEQKRETWCNYPPPSLFPLPLISPPVVYGALGPKKKNFNELHLPAPSQLLIPEM